MGTVQYRVHQKYIYNKGVLSKFKRNVHQLRSKYISKEFIPAKHYKKIKKEDLDFLHLDISMLRFINHLLRVEDIFHPFLHLLACLLPLLFLKQKCEFLERAPASLREQQVDTQCFE